jgi:ribosomal protein L11 methyltransferase
MEWVELSLPAGPLADEVAALLVATEPVFAGGAEVRGEHVILYAPADEAAAVADAMRAAATRLREHGFALDGAGLTIKPAPSEEEWRDGWKRFFHTRRLGPRLVIVPSWEREAFTPSDRDVVLDLDPGRAFGTGAHASTCLCLIELEALAEAGLSVRRFLDVGTGSGILSIACAKLWPGARGVATDVDPIAVSAALENLERNGVARRLEVTDAEIGALAPGTFELAVANIQADVLLGLRDALAARVAPGGALVLSGLLHDQAPFVADKYAQAGLTIARTLQIDMDREWMSVVLRRPA